MTGNGRPSAAADGTGLRVGVLASMWHAEIIDSMIARAQATIEESGATAEVVRVPGTFELALGAKQLAHEGFDAVVALGVVIRGGTPHFDYVCRAATDGLVRVGLDTGVPIGFGVLTCDTFEQAQDRSGLPGSAEDKGAEAAEAALAMVGVLRERTKQGAVGFGA